jgi:hypothetical protein
MDKRLLLTVPIIFLLASTLLLTYQNNYATLVVYAAGTPDSYGNRIISLCLQYWNGSAWVYFIDGYTYDGDIHEFPGDVTTAHEYVSGQIWWRVPDNKPLKFRIAVKLNKTLASSADDAVSKTRVYINITASGYSLINQLFGGAVGIDRTTYWTVVSLYTWNVTGQPYAGKQYSVAISYEAYY